MSRKSCKRKVWPLIDPISHAISGAAITDKAALDRLRLIELSSIESFAKGMATVSDWRILADMLNVSEQLALAGVDPDALEVNRQAQAVLREVADKGRLLFTGAQLHAMRESYACADRQRSSIARSELERVVTKTAAKVRQAQAEQVSQPGRHG